MIDTTQSEIQQRRVQLNPQAPIPPQLAKLDTERLSAYQTHRAFYDGQQWETRPRPRERQITLNYTRAFILKTVAYLMHGRAVGVEPVDRANTASATLARNVESLLRDLQHANACESEDYAEEVDAAVLGDGAYKVTWSNERAIPIVSSPDVRDLWWVRDWQDPTRLALVAHRYRPGPMFGDVANNPIHAAQQAAPDGIVTEVWTPELIEYWAGTTKHVATAPNPWGTIPFVIFPNVRTSTVNPWGSSDVLLLMDAAREINRAWTQLSNIMELSGNPIAVLENLDEQKGIQVAPGQVWAIPKDARAYILDLLAKGAGEQHLAYLNRAQQYLHDLGESPRTAWGDNSRQLSGRALEMELDPLGKLIGRKRAIRSVAYAQRDELMLLALSNWAPDKLAKAGVSSLDQIGRVTYVWGEVLATDRSQLVADEVALVTAGIHSRQGASSNLGDADPEGEWSRTIQELAERDSTTQEGEQP